MFDVAFAIGDSGLVSMPQGGKFLLEAGDKVVLAVERSG
jgi:hypothetical protein